MPVIETAAPFATFASIAPAAPLPLHRERQPAAGGKLSAHGRPSVAAPDGPPHLVELADELELVARLDDPLEAAIVDAGEQCDLPPVLLLREDGDGTGLRQRLDDQNARHHRPAGEVALQVPLVRCDALARDDAPPRLELEHLVDQEEGVAVGQDRLDPLASQR